MEIKTKDCTIVQSLKGVHLRDFNSHYRDSAKFKQRGGGYCNHAQRAEYAWSQMVDAQFSNFVGRPPVFREEFDKFDVRTATAVYDVKTSHSPYVFIMSESEVQRQLQFPRTARVVQCVWDGSAKRFSSVVVYRL